MYAWIDAVAQTGGLRGSGGDGSFQVRAWRALSGADARAAPAGGGLRRRGLAVAFPVVVAGLNRAGMGPLRADVSGHELRRAGLRAFGEVLARLGVPAGTHVMFGHTHRAGPLPADDPSEWGRVPQHRQLGPRPGVDRRLAGRQSLPARGSPRPSRRLRPARADQSRWAEARA